MSTDLSRRRLVTSGLAAAGLGAVPFVAANDAFATALCPPEPREGMWRADPLVLEPPRGQLTRLRLRRQCSTRPKERGATWYVTHWTASLGSGYGDGIERPLRHAVGPAGFELVVAWTLGTAGPWTLRIRFTGRETLWASISNRGGWGVASCTMVRDR